MEHQPLISVIVPVYKVEKYLDRCVDSIVNQTFKNLEIILVDDGSPDASPAICDAWEKRDSRIKVIHKENGGAGEARNVALDIATGTYISLIDSDDYIEPHMYEHLLCLMREDVDIAECGIIITEADNVDLDDGSEFVSVVYDTETAMKFHIIDSLFCQTPPNKLYRSRTIGDIRFPIGKQIDDEFWTYQVIARAKKLVRSSSNMYAYRQQSESVMNKTFTMGRFDGIEAKCQRLNLVEKKFPNLCSFARINLWQTCLYLGQMALRYLGEEEQKKAFSILDSAWNQYHVRYEDMKGFSITQRIWVLLTKLSVNYTCKLRNKLKIGT